MMKTESTFEFTINQSNCNDSITYMYEVYEQGNEEYICKRQLAKVVVEEKDITCTSIYQHAGQNFQLICKAVKQYEHEIDSIQFVDRNEETIERARLPVLGMGCRKETITIKDVLPLKKLFSDDGVPHYCAIDDTKKCRFSLQNEMYTLRITGNETQMIQFNCCTSERDIPDVWWIALNGPYRTENRDEYNVKQFVILCGRDKGREMSTFGVGRLVMASDRASILPIGARIMPETSDEAEMESQCKYKHVINITMSTPILHHESETRNTAKLVMNNDLPVCDHITLTTIYGDCWSEEESGKSIRVERGDNISVIGFIENITDEDRKIAILHRRDDSLSPCYLLPTGKCWNKISKRHDVGMFNRSGHSVKIEMTISALEFEDSGAYAVEFSPKGGSHCRILLTEIIVRETMPECSAYYLYDANELTLSCKWQSFSGDDVSLIRNNKTLYRSEHDIMTPSKTYFNTSKTITSGASLDDVFQQNRMADKCTLLQFGYEKSCQFYNFIDANLMQTVITLNRNRMRMTFSCCLDDENFENVWLYNKNYPTLFRVDISSQTFTETLVNNCDNIELGFICGKEMGGNVRVNTLVKFTLVPGKFTDSSLIEGGILHLSITPIRFGTLKCKHTYDITVNVFNTGSNAPLKTTDGYLSPGISISNCPNPNTTVVSNCPYAVSSHVLRSIPDPILIIANAIALLAIIFVLAKLIWRLRRCKQCFFSRKRKHSEHGSRNPHLSANSQEIMSQSATSIPLQTQQPSQLARGVHNDPEPHQDSTVNVGPELPSRPYQQWSAKDDNLQSTRTLIVEALTSHQMVNETVYSEYSMPDDTPTTSAVLATKDNIYCSVDDIDGKIGNGRITSDPVDLLQYELMGRELGFPMPEADNTIMDKDSVEYFPDHLYAKADKGQKYVLTTDTTGPSLSGGHNEILKSDDTYPHSDPKHLMYAQPDKCRILGSTGRATISTEPNSIQSDIDYAVEDKHPGVITDQKVIPTELHTALNYDIKTALCDSDYDSLKLPNTNSEIPTGDIEYCHLNPLCLGEACDEMDELTSSATNSESPPPDTRRDFSHPGDQTNAANYDNLQRHFVLTESDAEVPKATSPSFQPDGYNTLQNLFEESPCQRDSET